MKQPARAARPSDAVPGRWLRPLRDWPAAVVRGLEGEALIARVVLAAVRGSAPREAGVGMLVGAERIEGTIGGGQLEWQAITAARSLLRTSTSTATASARVERMVLGAQLAQCCGGVVELWIERYSRADLPWLHAACEATRHAAAVLDTRITPAAIEHRIVRATGSDADVDRLLRAPRARAGVQLQRAAGGSLRLLERLDDAAPPLWLYGAGHVGQALARILMDLPLRLTWIDSRRQLFPADLPASVQVLHSVDPVQSVAAAPPASRFMVLTHSHPLDYELCRAILTRSDIAWAGLIGSSSKAARFRSRLARDGLPAEAIARLVCPIGVGGIASKWPAAIAVGVAAQLLQDIDAAAQQLPAPPAAPPMPLSAAAGSGCAAADCAHCGAQQPTPAARAC
jgi:xanthine dehydrogenase accessory factor